MNRHRGKEGLMEWERISSPKIPTKMFQERKEDSMLITDTKKNTLIVETEPHNVVVLCHQKEETPPSSPCIEAPLSVPLRNEALQVKYDEKENFASVGFYAMLPYTLVGYIQLVYHLSVICIFLYVFYLFGSTLYYDYQLRLVSKISEASLKQQDCLAQYRANLCLENPVPALLGTCQTWLDCSKQEPEKIYRIPVLLELLSEWLNIFLEGLSYKTMLLLAISLVLLSVFTNAIFSLAKSKALFQNNKIDYH